MPLSSDVLAITTPFNNYNPFSGDVIVNTAAFAAGGSDLYTVMLQEAGHALSVGNSLDPASVMYEHYLGALRSSFTSDPTANNVSLALGSVLAGATYYVRVSGARGDAFDIGSYELRVEQRSLLGRVLGAVGGIVDVAGSTLAGALTLLSNSSTVGVSNEFSVDGRLDSASDRDVYRIVIPLRAAQ